MLYTFTSSSFSLPTFLASKQKYGGAGELWRERQPAMGCWSSRFLSSGLSVGIGVEGDGGTTGTVIIPFLPLSILLVHTIITCQFLTVLMCTFFCG